MVGLKGFAKLQRAWRNQKFASYCFTTVFSEIQFILKSVFEKCPKFKIVTNF